MILVDGFKVLLFKWLECEGWIMVFGCIYVCVLIFEGSFRGVLCGSNYTRFVCFRGV